MTPAFRDAFFSTKPLSIYIGPITRKDGMVVPLFCDMVPLMFTPKSLNVLTRELVELVRDIEFDVVAGALTAGVPLAAAVAYEMGKRFCWVRKESKGYSQNRAVDGALDAGDRVVLFDDFFVRGEMKELFLNHLAAVGVKTVAICSAGVINPDVARSWAAGRGLEFRYAATYMEVFRDAHARGILSAGLVEISEAFVNDMMGWNKDEKLWQRLLVEKARHPHLERK